MNTKPLGGSQKPDTQKPDVEAEVSLESTVSQALRERNGPGAALRKSPYFQGKSSGQKDPKNKLDELRQLSESIRSTPRHKSAPAEAPLPESFADLPVSNPARGWLWIVLVLGTVMAAVWLLAQP